MTIAETLLPEFDQEMKTTRAVLERVPEKDADWAPHAKSMPLGKLAIHVATMPGWVRQMLENTELDLAKPDSGATPPFESAHKTLEAFDAAVKEGRAALARTADADFAVSWALKHGDKTFFSMPRVAVMRYFVMNHLVHHRGQLTVYLRLRDVALPSVYGPTADAPMM